VKEALEEGISIEFLTNPSKIWKHNGNLKMSCTRMKLGDIDSSGRRRPEPLAGSEFEADFDAIVAAIGQRPDIPEQMGPKANSNGTLWADPDTLATDLDGVFAGGDVVSGPASVIEAIAAGRQAAVSIDRYLGGQGLIDEKLAPPEEITGPFEMQEQEAGKRTEMPLLAAGKRLKSFDVVELGYTKELACEEAERCLRCDLEEE
jgi:NADPH-dependent glutamate synthase beta subunit-like oxidoreductase